MTRLAVAYAAAAVVLAVLDGIWLSTVGRAVFRPQLAPLLLDRLNWPPAIVFYVLYVAGVLIFAMAPALKPGGTWMQAALTGALFGLFCYATYDLTNMATLKVWPLKVAVLDVAWGALVTGAAAGAGVWAAQRWAG